MIDLTKLTLDQLLELQAEIAEEIDNRDEDLGLFEEEEKDPEIDYELEAELENEPLSEEDKADIAKAQEWHQAKLRQYPGKNIMEIMWLEQELGI